jgi:glycosyltransferase involved in cell wall biosynthesis
MNQHVASSLPPVSVIVPAYNAEGTIEQLLESLMNQQYPKDLLEIIIVDNNSIDSTGEIVRKYPVRFLQEKECQSSYAARNRAIRAAGGQILAFTDADCQAQLGWLKAGVEALARQSADLAAGRVEFNYSPEKTAAEYYDSITQMHTDSSIRQYDSAATANLFVRAELFDKLGLFPLVASGGDWQWTSQAVRSGFRLVYAPDAIVRHPARLLIPLLKKSFRIGGGAISVWAAEKRGAGAIAYSTLMLLKPPRLLPIKKLVAERGNPEMSRKLLKIWLVSYLWNIAKACGIIMSALGLGAPGPR